MSEINIQNILRFWAKLPHSDQENTISTKFHPLICHMIDVAVVTREMWKQVLSTAARQHIAQALTITIEQAEIFITFLAALHDLGKASPAFQLRDAAKNLLFLYSDMGKPPLVKPSDIPHGRVTAKELTQILEKTYGVNRKLARQVSKVIGGHHGSFPTDEEFLTKYPPSGAGQNIKSWDKLRSELVIVLLENFNALEVIKNFSIKTVPHAVSMIIAGLVSVADWVGSNSDFFPYEVEDFNNLPKFDIQDYLQRATKQAQRALKSLGWLTASQPKQSSTFTELFPNLQILRPLQKAATELAERIGSPAIAIVEAPMGEGKTETAMYLADHWAANNAAGFYIALPTQATSNQMFSRAKAFLNSRYSAENEKVNLQLLHGHAALSAEFQLLQKEGSKVFKIDGVYADGDCCATETNVLTAEWFTHRKRGLLAPFGVGTVDQAMLAVLQTRHVFVRLFGLAHKVVIIDEVHAYDAYMSKILERLLEWLAALGSPVILLSATLPKSRRNALLAAYYRGLNNSNKSPNLDHLQQAYPCISWANNQEIAATTISVSPEITRTLKIEWVNGHIPDPPNQYFELAEKLIIALSDGGCAAIICNTVNRAQQVYQALKTYFEFKNIELDLDLFHARYLFKDRAEREKRVLSKFGKPKDLKDSNDSSVKRPFRAILVATQVIEQSLDLDFDLMVTDIAPIDLILQRSGRLHRHQRPRLPKLSQPTLWVCKPEISVDCPKFDGLDTLIYDEHILLRSFLALANRSEIEIPESVEPLVEACYNDSALCPMNASTELQAQWQKTKAELANNLQKLEMLPSQVVVPPPYYPDNNLLDLCNRSLEEDRPDLHTDLQARTRLTEPSVSVICLLPNQYDKFDWAKPPNLSEIKELLTYSATLQNKKVVFSLLGNFDESVCPPNWRTSALLRNHRLLKLTTTGIWPDPNKQYEIHLDKDLGIIIN